jgi:hypothetical protein
MHTGPNIVREGLILYLDAGNVKSYPRTGLFWTDLTINSNNGVLTNGAIYNADNGGSVFLDGNDDYVVYPLNGFPSGNSEITICSWIKWGGIGINNINVIIGFGHDIAAHKVPGTGIVNNKFVFSFGSGSGLVESINNINIGQWYYLVATYDKSYTKTYINDALNCTPIAYSTADITLNGSNGYNGGIGCLFSVFGTVGSGITQRYGTFYGNIGNVQIYNRSLFLIEIQQNYNALKSRFGL